MNSYQKIIVLLSIGFTTLFSLALLHAQDDKASSARVAEAPAGLQIGPGDLLEISIFGQPDFTRQVRVSEKGEISLPLVGNIKVSGLSTEQIQEITTRKLEEKELFNDPQVSVVVKELATQGISVLGEVQKPGTYPPFGERRLMDLISAAGGLTPKAGREVTVSHRGRQGAPITLALNDPKTTDLQLAPGDTVLVSQAGVVYVIGDVAKPGGFVLEDRDQISALQAVALAGGTNPTAATQGTKIIRNQNTAGQQQIAIPLKPVLEGKASDPILQRGDILFVPTSAAKRAMTKTLDAIVRTATGMAIYSTPTR